MKLRARKITTGLHNIQGLLWILSEPRPEAREIPAAGAAANHVAASVPRNSNAKFESRILTTYWILHDCLSFLIGIRLLFYYHTLGLG